MSHNTTTPIEITNSIRSFCKYINEESIPVYLSSSILEEGAQQLECFNNVRMKIEKDGGGIRYGWLIWEWPNVLVEAEFHAVWISPKGELVDVTPRIDAEEKVLFLPDNNRTYEGIRVGNIRRALRDVPLIHSYLSLCENITEYLIKGELNKAEYQQFITLQNEKKCMIEQLKSLKINRNEPCPCGSGIKYKKCHGK